MIPSFWSRLADPAIRTVLLCGCGGGFDFLHALTLHPELRRLGKRLVYGSYSFGDPRRIGGEAPVVFRRDAAVVRAVSARSVADPHYAPEIHLCSYLDALEPASAPHSVYAYYARAFTVPVLSEFYRELVDDEEIDAVLLFDGGSDSLMAGDEEGLGDPIEDAVSVAAVDSLERPRLKVLFSVGFGADRFNRVSDAASLRAVAELTRRGGFLGALALEAEHSGTEFYRGAIEHVYQRQSFRSALTGFILSAARGCFAGQAATELMPERVRPGGFFVWPLMAMLWAFDVETVAARSMIVDWIRSCTTVEDCYRALADGRARLPGGLRGVENLPAHEDFRRS
ncbi:MAG: DUF1152 domain-containing protein [Deltaproteobacteria bacterium]|jgi:hypothetical protein|nr:DUF1152 domain-containing protein [Deltaproteobacteria bacterium]